MGYGGVSKEAPEVVKAFIEGRPRSMKPYHRRDGIYAPQGTIQTNHDATVITMFGHWTAVVKLPEAVAGKLGVKYLLNGDSVSKLTGQYQNMLLRMLTPSIQIPFSACQSAGIPIDKYDAWERGEVEVVDYVKDSWIPLKRNGEYMWRSAQLARTLDDTNIAFSTADVCKHLSVHKACLEFSITDTPQHTCMECATKLGNCQVDVLREHYLGAVLFERHGIGGSSAGMYLSAFDLNETKHRHYFLTRLPDNATGDTVRTVGEAYQALKPWEVTAAEYAGMEVVRQWDVFFIKCSEEMQKDARKYPKQTKRTIYTNDGAVLPDKCILKSSHYATEVRLFHTQLPASGDVTMILVRGCITHRPMHAGAKHSRITLGDGKRWYRAVKNTATGSWEARGNVD